MTKRRALVLTDETARHPFLRSLPPHVRRGIAPVRPRERKASGRLGWQDLRDFLSAYCACFVATVTFFA
ncbi:MAG TPA: hypothetical protein VF440_01245 [Novosphingobium sp.]